MADCEFLAECPFFNDKMAKMPRSASVMKETYCKGDFTRCARHRIATTLGRDKMPLDLWPQDGQKAEAALAGKK